MLEPKEKGKKYGKLVIDSEKGRRLALSPDKGDVGREEEGIVVVADEAVSGEKCMPKVLHSAGKGLLAWLVLGRNLGGALILIHDAPS